MACLTILQAAQPVPYCVLKHTNCDEIMCTIHRNNAHISVNLYRFLPSCRRKTRRMILGCPAAKWVISDARNALILCPDIWGDGPGDHIRINAGHLKIMHLCRLGGQNVHFRFSSFVRK